jgi:2-phosphoglycerate kinase
MPTRSSSWKKSATVSINNLYFIGGSPCGGKSSVADWLSRHFNITVYHIDAHINRHLAMITPQAQPALHRWETQTWDQRWLQPLDQLLQDAIDSYTEHFSLLLPELLEQAATGTLIVEGNPLLPALITPYLANHSQAIYLIAPPDLLRHFYNRRNWAFNVLKQCSDPEQAFNNWMERDIAFARHVEDQCRQYHLRCLVSEDKLSIEAKAITVADHFGLNSGL